MTKYFIHIFIFIFLSISSVFAETFEVEMLNKHDGQINVFNPPIVNIAVGDTVNWTSVNPGHNIAFTKKGVPDGVEKFKSKKNIKILNRAIKFVGDNGFLYKANYSLRTAIKILKPVKVFKIDDQEDFYKKILYHNS